MTSNKTAAERIAAMRKCYANSPEPVNHLSDLELVFRELDAAVKNECRVQADYDRMLQERNRWERDIRSGANRAAREHERAWVKEHLKALLHKAQLPITALIYQAEQVGPKVGNAQLHTLHMFAREAAEALKQPVNFDDLKVAEYWRAEAWRLRDVVMNTGRALHAEFAESSKGGCHCCGCELIRDIDDAPKSAPQDMLNGVLDETGGSDA